MGYVYRDVVNEAGELFRQIFDFLEDIKWAMELKLPMESVFHARVFYGDVREKFNAIVEQYGRLSTELGTLLKVESLHLPIYAKSSACTENATECTETCAESTRSSSTWNHTKIMIPCYDR